MPQPMFSPRCFSFATSFALLFAVACGGVDPASTTNKETNAPTGTPSGTTSGNDGTTNNGDPSQPVSKVATIRVHYPVGSRSLALQGDHAPLTAAGTPLTAGANDTSELSLGEIDAPVSFVPVLDGTPARGPAYTVAPGQTLDIFPHFTATQGTIKGLGTLTSAILNNTRGLRVYLPPSYEENTAARYPVVYMHDGQVIFDGDIGPLDGAAKSFFGSWKAEKVVDEGIENGSLPEMIIIGVDIIINFDITNLLANLTAIREQELTPTEVPSYRKGSGRGPLYLRMIVEELKPAIDKNFRTLPDRDHTMIAGSSLGGLMSIWAGMDHGDVFGRVLAMSSSAWWDNEIAAKRMSTEKGGPKRADKAYTDVGDNESGQSSAEADAADLTMVEQNQHLWDAYRGAGYVDDQTLKTRLEPGGQHNGASWSPRFGAALAFLFGSGR